MSNRPIASQVFQISDANSMPESIDPAPAVPRVPSLDYLRGLLALAVMAYHYSSWATGPWDAATLMGRLGIYAVPMFYLLSGLSLSLVYRGRLRDVRGVLGYGIKRVFRIFPLFWVAVTVAVALAAVHAVHTGVPYSADWWRLFLNYSLLFGFVQPTAYLTTGAWSIGNEMVFYALFPLILMLAERSRTAFVLLLCAAVGLAVYVATSHLDAAHALSDQWASYISPLNQVAFFVVGMALPMIVVPRAVWRRGTGWALVGLGCLTFLLLPGKGDPIVLVCGWVRIAFLLACSCVVLGIFWANPGLGRSRIASLLSFFGEGCYSIYLLHPLVGAVVAGVLVRLGVQAGLGYLVAAAVTLVVAMLSFRFLEQPMMRQGSRFAKTLVIGKHKPGSPETQRKR